MENWATEINQKNIVIEGVQSIMKSNEEESQFLRKFIESDTLGKATITDAKCKISKMINKKIATTKPYVDILHQYEIVIVFDACILHRYEECSPYCG